MVSLQTHVIADLRSATHDIDIRTLVHGALLKDKVVPVHIRIDIRIDAAAGIIDSLLTVLRRRIGRSCQLGLVIDFHPPGTIHITYFVDRFQK